MSRLLPTSGSGATGHVTMTSTCPALVVVRLRVEQSPRLITSSQASASGTEPDTTPLNDTERGAVVLMVAAAGVAGTNAAGAASAVNVAVLTALSTPLSIALTWNWCVPPVRPVYV